MLHTLSHSPWQCDITSLARNLCAGDDLLLMQDGVVAGIEGNDFLDVLSQKAVSLYALREDVLARGIAARISTRITSIDYNDFVRLVIKHPSQMAW